MNDERVSIANPSASTLQAQIDLKTTPERVYAAWTRAEEFSQWFGPRKGGHLQVDRFEPAVGGDYDVTMVFADGDRAQMTGRYLELDPPRRIVLTWIWREGGQPSEEPSSRWTSFPRKPGRASPFSTNASRPSPTATTTRRAGQACSPASTLT